MTKQSIKDRRAFRARDDEIGLYRLGEKGNDEAISSVMIARREPGRMATSVH